MKIWLPYTRGGSGTDVFTETLAEALRAKGLSAQTCRFPHMLQYAPWLLRLVTPPPETDIILANTWNALAFKRPGISLVAVQHLLVIDPALAPYRTPFQALFHHALVRNYEFATNRRADQVVAVSEFTGARYAQLLGVEPPLVIRNGIDTEFFCPGDPDGNDPEFGESAKRPFRLLFVGNFNRRKGADLIPAILSELGDGYEFSYTSGLRAKAPLSSSIKTRPLGRLDRDGVRREYRRADLLLFPTRLEGLPLVAMEALACGTPVIASKAASLPEVVIDGKTGWLCPLDDVSAFASAIRGLRNNPLQRQQFAQRARDDAERRFSIHRMADDYLALFEQLMRRGNI